MSKTTRGGKREGSGRPPSPPTKIITFRVRMEWEKQIRNVVAKEIKRLKSIPLSII